MRHLDKLKGTHEIGLKTDAGGYTGRECPECGRYFKLVFATGIAEVVPCHCPYCGHVADQDEFATEDQVAYVESVLMQRVEKALAEDLNDWAAQFNRRQRDSLIQLEVESSVPISPLQDYSEKELETCLVCESCSLQYAVYGVFAYCPDCGKHNSLQILEANLDLIAKMLSLVEQAEDEQTAQRLTENALEDCVAVFDGFGREVCRIHTALSKNAESFEKIRFQNLRGARKNLEQCFGIDLKAGAKGDWDRVVALFQKRHLYSHKMGVVDEEYVRKSGDTTAIPGRKAVVRESEVRFLLPVIESMAQHLFTEMSKLENHKFPQESQNGG